MKGKIFLAVVVLAAGILGMGFDIKTQIGQEDFLHTESGNLVNESGDKVLLQGVNLGGWLIQESWMCPVSGENRKWANLDTLTVLEQRFGEEKAAELINTYQDNWITEWDIWNIARRGCNVVRVPFWYRNFMKDTQGTWITDNPDDNPGFKRLDWIIETAGKYGMYVILDMHGCPGGQSMDHSSGTLCVNELYTNETCQNTMELLWTAIAQRYKDNPVVAAYDIMNEPQNNDGYEGENSYNPWNSQSWELTNQIYAKMIYAIRQVDNRHVITVEGIWRASNLPNPSKVGWDNVMYQIHLYDDDDAFASLTADLAMRMSDYGVAGYVGEFQNLNGIEMCKSQNINWTTWTYKGTSSYYSTFFWYFGFTDEADVEHDSYEDIKQKWGKSLNTILFQEIKPVTEAIENATS